VSDINLHQEPTPKTTVSHLGLLTVHPKSEVGRRQPNDQFSGEESSGICDESEQIFPGLDEICGWLRGFARRRQYHRRQGSESKQSENEPPEWLPSMRTHILLVISPYLVSRESNQCPLPRRRSAGKLQSVFFQNIELFHIGMHLGMMLVG
jgi:hypothetical protein